MKILNLTWKQDNKMPNILADQLSFIWNDQQLSNDNYRIQCSK